MSKQVQDVFVVNVQRTPVAKANRGSFKHVRPDDLMVHTIKDVLSKNPNLDPARIGDLIVGCAMPEGVQGLNIGRNVALLSGLPQSVPGMTVNRFCCSGVQTMALAADRIALGYDDAILAGGLESMTMVPMGGFNPSANPDVFTQDENIGIAYGMGITAELVANKWNVSREAQDEFAYTSHQRAINATDAGHFKDEILPYEVTLNQANLDTGETVQKQVLVEHDEGPRRDTTVEGLAKLKPVFAQKGSVTAGNSSQMSDGAGVALLVGERMLKELNLTPMAMFIGYAVAGVAPEHMGIGPMAAIPKVLEQTGLSLQDMDWIELNEAFAAQSLAVIGELGLDPAKVNPNGGAIALGHPLGATGAIRVATTLHGLNRIQKRYGMVTMCIGTGMGAAAIFERL